ncbi:MAG: hypothetical protein MUD14_15495 [Hydrococcus sp. Prado102]|jgi:hypothetical protein|nr:hypothetical protein [Hydrococcus sp. Prado102]
MSHQYSSFDCTSEYFEKAALNRFRSLVAFLPQDCKIFREPWDCSTILCLDFANCPDKLDAVIEKAALLLSAAQELGLTNAIVFRIANKFLGRVGNTSF